MQCVPIAPHERELTEAIADKVVVAMSGGVDSSVAALLLRESGVACVGVSMQVWDYRNHGGSSSRATCCAPSDFNDARRVSASVGMPYYVLDFENFFKQTVIDQFVQAYTNGLTPNPCVECNRKVKFRELRARAFRFGCKVVATGHYARITKDESGYHLRRGRDSKKDQSYFLYSLTQDELATTLFPIGELTKPEVRALAEKAGLVTAAKAESQDICFISGSVKNFVEAHGGTRRPGKIVSTAGAVLGAHDGVHSFTVGQRKGLRLGGSEESLYVLELNTEEQLVVVGTRTELEQSTFSLSNITVVNPRLLRALADAGSAQFDAIAQLRHGHSGVPVTVTLSQDLTASVQFKDGWTTVTPGQAGVLYCLENDEVLAGGTIDRPLHMARRMLTVVN